MLCAIYDNLKGEKCLRLPNDVPFTDIDIAELTSAVYVTAAFVINALRGDGALFTQ